MNEKIRELAKQAGQGKPFHIPPQFVAKFAELIVKECLNNMNNCAGDLDFAIWKTEKDFGVEE